MLACLDDYAYVKFLDVEEWWRSRQYIDFKWWGQSCILCASS